MATAFRATSSGYRADLDTHERRIISTLCADVIQLLRSRESELAADQTDTSSFYDDGDPALNADSAGNDASGTDEDSVFAHFRAELAGLGEGTTIPEPTDAALRRLLPHASEDPELAAQFRRFSESSVRDSKIADLRAAQVMLQSSPVRVQEASAPVLGRAFNDIRLILSTRLGIETQADADKIHELIEPRKRRRRHGRSGAQEEHPDPTTLFMAEIYTFITWLQDSLLTAMTEFLEEDDADADKESGSSGE